MWKQLVIILLCLLLSACALLRHEATPTKLVQSQVKATTSAEPVIVSQTATASPIRSVVTPTNLPSATPALTPSPAPTATPTPTSVLMDGLRVVAFNDLNLVGPVMVDEMNGRLFVGAWTGQEPKLAVLVAANGDLITTFETDSGAFGLDPQRGCLYLDDPDTGLIVLDSTSGAEIKIIPLPAPEYVLEPLPDPPGQPWPDALAPQIDPASGYVLAFRNNRVYVSNPDTAEIVKVFTVAVPYKDLPDVVGDIEWARYDASAQILYLAFPAYAPGTIYPYFTLVAYDMKTDAEIARYGDDEDEFLPFYYATPFEGYMYVTRFHRYGAEGHADHSIWVSERSFQIIDSEVGRRINSPPVVDTRRRLLYELAEENIRVYALETFQLLWLQPTPLKDEDITREMSVYDSSTEQLYFLDEGILNIWPTQNIQPPSNR